MRKVTFYINDREFFRKELIEREGVPPEKAEEIISRLKNFVAVFSIIGNGKSPDRYELYDVEGNKLNINQVNNYEKGVILNECMSYFEGGMNGFSGDHPQGVIRIVETEI